VGKTVVTAWLVRWFRQQGYPVSVRKPVATGADREGDVWVNDDTRRLAQASDFTGELSSITRWTFPEPVAPTVAARLHDVELTLSALTAAALDGVPDGTVLLVEGIGGLLCPLTDTDTVADLAAILGLPVVLVAHHSLGTLSQTLLAVEVACHRCLPLVGVVVSETTPCRGLAEETNVAELRARLRVPLLAVVHHASHPDTAPQPELAAVAWDRLCRGNPDPVPFDEERFRPWKP
jgi:dethiobiotin synthetase